jgi:hypothetical protein
MTLTDYFNEKFFEEIKKIPVTIPNEEIRSNPVLFNSHDGMAFFGGRDWENYTQDMENIDKGNEAEFMLCLLLLGTMDYAIKSNPEKYHNLARKYDAPMLGWTGLGPHFEHPSKLLNAYLAHQGVWETLLQRKEETKELFALMVNSRFPLHEAFLTPQVLDPSKASGKSASDDFCERIDHQAELDWIEKISALIQ